MTEQLTHHRFASLLSHLAMNAARWSAETLSLPECASKPVQFAVVARFLAEMRPVLDYIEEQAIPDAAERHRRAVERTIREIQGDLGRMPG